MSHFLYRVFCGFFLGISIFAPGVSGSVMAVMMGIYSKLLDIVANPFKDFKKNVVYLFPMGIGAVISLVLFVLGFSYLFKTYPKATYLLFMGLIAGNLPVVFKDALQGDSANDRSLKNPSAGWKNRYLLSLVPAFALALGVGILRANSVAASSVTLPYLALCGAVAGVCSMMPGMSISMVLMVLGVYDHILASAKAIDILPLVIWGGCFLVGMVGFSRLTKWALARYHSMAYFGVLGFMSGSLIGIYLGLPKEDPNFTWLVGILAIAGGLGIAALFFALGKRFNVEEMKA